MAEHQSPPSSSEAGWRSTLGLAAAMRWLLGATALVAWMGSGEAIVRAQASDSALRHHDWVASGVLDVLSVLIAASGVCFLIWQSRCVRDQRLLGREGSRASPVWAVLWWFMPVGNLFMPARLVQDLWRSSGPSSRPGSEWRSNPRSALVSWWWVSLLGSWSVVLVLAIFPELSGHNRSTSTIRTADWIGSAWALIWASAAVLSILTVRAITARQEQVREREGLRTQRMAGAAWFPDPLGRFETRYWDGNDWTSWVATQGAVHTDALIAGASELRVSRRRGASGRTERRRARSGSVSMNTPAPTPPPGWYHDGTSLRWWDGFVWGVYGSPPSSDPVEQGKTLACLSHLGVMFLFVVPSLAIRVTEGRRNLYVRHHSTEALNFMLTFVLLWVAIGLPTNASTPGTGQAPAGWVLAGWATLGFLALAMLTVLRVRRDPGVARRLVALSDQYPLRPRSPASVPDAEFGPWGI